MTTTTPIQLLSRLILSLIALSFSIAFSVICFIFGASRGIGKALAVQYSTNGKKVIITGHDEKTLKEVHTICARRGATVISHLIDETDEEAMEKWLKEVDSQNQIDLLIANTSVSAVTMGDKNMDIEKYTDVLFDINISSILNTIHPLIPLFRSRRRGQIAIVSSLMSHLPIGAYSAAKACMSTYGEALRLQLCKYNIQVSVIAPPYIRSSSMPTTSLKYKMATSAEDFAIFCQNGLINNEPIISPWSAELVMTILGCVPVPLLDCFLQSYLSFSSRGNKNFSSSPKHTKSQ
eukprot:TRINITY_DN6401_c0_g1_i2.p1 TRINITY_DN6401_c0_g1~~TRINITY_DN6401_c0_g1_i2.p1  ORF type:complete len:292 (+),score=60.93 TRINITY_DN6401_c0_g1_i2:57-932(+)